MAVISEEALSRLERHRHRPEDNDRKPVESRGQDGPGTHR